MDQNPLYDIPVDPAALEVTSFCGGTGSSLEGCVQIAKLPGTNDAYVLLDGKPGAPEGMQRYTGAELTDFAEGWLRAHQ